MIEEKNFIINQDTGESIDINESKFKFVQKDKKIHDVKFKSKPTTFFKDSMKRFVKSKPALIGGIIVGIIILGSLITPAVMPNTGAYDVSKDSVGGDVNERYIQPKLFPSGTGFWDGTLTKKHVLYDSANKAPVGFRDGVFSNVTTYEEIGEVANEFGTGGEVLITAFENNSTANMYSDSVTLDFKNTYTFKINTKTEDIKDYKIAPYKVVFSTSTQKYDLLPYSNKNEQIININEVLKSKGVDLSNPSTGKFTIETEKSTTTAKSALLVESVKIETNSTDEEEIKKLNTISFEDGNSCLLRKHGEPGYWGTTSKINGHNISYTFCDFTYDQYEDIYGAKPKTYSFIDVLQLETKGFIKINLTKANSKATTDEELLKQRFEIISDQCPVLEINEQVGDAKYNALTRKWEGYELKVKTKGYLEYGYDSMPMFIFGTNNFRKDYLKLITTGLRTSLLLAIVVASINIVIGLIWGSISGYFGGWTDILMERFCEILSGLPTTVLITLCILYGREFKWGDSADVIALMLALFLTGWMGVAHQTRTQFYRFKNREYVLASRTLGSKDARLIFRHILPNSMGTIITGSILMIPSVIYTEASIAYLKLGLTNQIMFGVILAQANTYYHGENMYLLIVPTVIMAFLLISFNLFGNGLREAFNPSLKGSE